MSTNPSSYATLSVLAQKCWISGIHNSFKGGTGPISQLCKLKILKQVHRTSRNRSIYRTSMTTVMCRYLFWVIRSISLPVTILNRLIILHNNISTEEIEITCPASGIFGLSWLQQVLIWVQRSLSYCTITDSIVRIDRHADVILLAYLGLQLILTKCRTRSKKETDQNLKNLLENQSLVLYMCNLNKLTILLRP